MYDETAELALGTAPEESEADFLSGGSVINPEERRGVPPRTESLGDMFASFADHCSTFMRQEIALANAEVTDTAKKAGTGPAYSPVPAWQLSSC